MPPTTAAAPTSTSAATPTSRPNRRLVRTGAWLLSGPLGVDARAPPEAGAPPGRVAAMGCTAAPPGRTDAYPGSATVADAGALPPVGGPPAAAGPPRDGALWRFGDCAAGAGARPRLSELPAAQGALRSCPLVSSPRKS